MTKPYKVYITEDDLYEEKGYSLNTSLRVDHTGDIEQTKKHFLDEIASIIYTKIVDITKNSDRAELICTDPYFETKLARLQLEQAVYVLENGNIYSVADDSGQIDMTRLKADSNALSSLVEKELEAMPIRYLGMC